MGKEEMRQAIFQLVEYVSQYELSPTGQKLVIHYFNSSTASSTYERAVEAVERYFPEQIPGHADRPPRLQNILDDLKKECRIWDAEE